MPSSVEQINETHNLFKRLGYGNRAIGLPGVDGAIDCTHIRLTQCKFDNIQEIYRNRKGYFSLNVQVSNFLFYREYYRIYICKLVRSLIAKYFIIKLFLGYCGTSNGIS